MIDSVSKELEVMSVSDLDQLLAQITKRIAEEQWKVKARQLEVEVTDAVNALREFTGRNYTLSLGIITLVPRPKRVRCRLRIAA